MRGRELRRWASGQRAPGHGARAEAELICRHIESEGRMSARVVAIVGSYRSGGVTDRAVEAVLDGARVLGAQTRTFHLTEQHIEFCTNCRECTQQPGVGRGLCKQKDDLEPMLREIEAADAVVLASPVNYYNVTAIFRRFLERLLGIRLLAVGPDGAQAPHQAAAAQGGACGHIGCAGVSHPARHRRRPRATHSGCAAGRKAGGQAVGWAHGRRDPPHAFGADA